MGNVANQAVENSFRGENLTAKSPKRFDGVGSVFGSTAAEGVDEKGNVDIFVDCLQTCLVNADRCF